MTKEGVREGFKAGIMVRPKVLLRRKMKKGQFNQGKTKQKSSRDIEVPDVF